MEYSEQNERKGKDCSLIIDVRESSQFGYFLI